MKPEAIKMMIRKLYEQIESGWIDDSCWEYSFIISVKERIDLGYELTEKQVNKLEEVFNRN